MDDLEKYEKLKAYIKSLGSDADINMLRIIGPDPVDALQCELTEQIIDRVNAQCVELYGSDPAWWPTNKKMELRIFRQDVAAFKATYEPEPAPQLKSKGDLLL